MRIFFKWPGHKLSEVYIDIMFMIVYENIKSKTPNRNYLKTKENNLNKTT
jgi:hypothetical protein